MLEKLRSRYHKCKNKKMLSASTIMLLVLVCLYGTSHSANAADQHIPEQKASKFRQYWNGVSPLFASIFGTTDIKIDSNTIDSLKDFEEFLSKLCSLKNCKLIKTTVAGDQITNLPKPLILIYDSKDGFLVVPQVFEHKGCKVYQVIGADKEPMLASSEKEKDALSGEAWYIDHTGQSEVTHKSGNISLRISEAIHNFGLVEPSQLHRNLKIKNIGQASVIIKKPKNSCRCTVAEFKGDHVLEPLEQTELTISVTVGRGNKGFRHSILIPFEDTISKEVNQLKFDLIGSCVDDAPIVMPPILVFNAVTTEEKPRRTIRLAESQKEKLGNIRVKASSKALYPKVLGTRSYSDRQEFLVEITLDGKQLEPGKSYDEMILIETQNPKYDLVQVPVHIETLADISCIPSVIFWGICKAGKEVERTVRLWHRKGQRLKVGSCEAPNHYEIEIENKEQYLNLRFRTKFDAPGTYKEQITILLENPENTQISIPTYAIVEKN